MNKLSKPGDLFLLSTPETFSAFQSAQSAIDHIERFFPGEPIECYIDGRRYRLYIAKHQDGQVLPARTEPMSREDCEECQRELIESNQGDDWRFEILLDGEPPTIFTPQTKTAPAPEGAEAEDSPQNPSAG